MTDAPQSDHLEKVLERALKRFDTIWATASDERKQCLEDRRFYSIRGAQWDDAWGTQFENAPRMEINKTHGAIIRIFSDYRNNRISVDFRPKDDSADPETAEALDGLYRADEKESGAQEAYDLAFEEAVGGGFGAWRLRACYEDESDKDNDHQRVRFEPIPDADQRVFFDLAAERQDKSDARYGFILTPMTTEAYEDEYDETADSFPAPDVGSFEWFRPESVMIAEYYEVEEKTTLKVTLGHKVLEENEKILFDPPASEIEELEVQGWEVRSRRKIKQPRVHKYILSGNRVLSDDGLIAGRHIPIVPVYGKRWFVDGVERCAGHVRYAKDPQRVYNAEVSQLAEIAGMSQHERPIFDPEQVAGHETSWAEGNINRSPYQLANALRNDDGTIAHMGPIGKVEAPTVPQSLGALIQIAGQDIAELMGANDQLDEVPANTSAQAIELVHTRADTKTFIYLDNMGKAMERCGAIWLSMASELYVEEGRKMQTLDAHGEQSEIKLAEAGLDRDKNAITRYDFTNAKFDVVVDVGPASATRRDATVRSLVGMAAVSEDPELKNVCISTALINMDGEGIDDVQKWLRLRLVRQGVIQPSDEEKAMLEQEAANAQPDPQAELLAGATEQARAEAEKARAQTIKTLAEVELTEAKTAEIAAQADGQHPDQIIRAAEAAARTLQGERRTNGAPQ